MTPRGIRNNNPGNIERGIKWQGLAKAHELDTAQKKEDRFAVFRSPEWGIRAMARIIQTYRTKYGLNTVIDIVSRWAPSHENDTHSYAHAVAQSIGVAPDEIIDTSRPDTLVPLIQAMILHENGIQPYSEATIRAGVALAGLGPKTEVAPKPVSKSKRVRGAVATAAASGAVSVLNQSTDLVKSSQSFLTNLFGVDIHDYPVPLIIIAISGAVFILYVGWTVWMDYKDDREPDEVV